MKQPDFAKWYFYQLLKDYEGEQQDDAVDR